MDLYTAGVVLPPIVIGWIVWRLAKRYYRRREVTIFPPDRRRAVHVLDVKDDVSQTF